jgi:putative tricarboxylic transport membrane protein
LRSIGTLRKETTMSHNDDGASDEPALVSNRAVDIVVALLFLVASAIVIYDSSRLGFGWREGEGPAPGYFPFYIAMAMATASLVNLARAVLANTPGAGEAFVSKVGFWRVLQVLIPTIAYVGLIHYLGIYVASAIFIMGFMTVFGREGLIKTVGIGIAVPLMLFFMFERWFLVPLPKGPLEAMLGLG